MNELSPKPQLSIQKRLDTIHRCRDSGLSNHQWCEENSVELKHDYYWLSKIRKQVIENITRKTSVSPTTTSTVSSPVNTCPGTWGDRKKEHQDAYKGYEKVTGITRCFCWTHVRIYFVDTLPKDVNSPQATIPAQTVGYINRPFTIGRKN